MTVVLTRVQHIVQRSSKGLAAHTPVVCVVVLCTVLFASRDAFSTQSNVLSETMFLIGSFVPALGLLACLLQVTEQFTKERTTAVTKSVIDSAAIFDGGRRNRRAVPAEERASPEKRSAVRGGPAYSGDRPGHEWRPWRPHTQIIDCAQRAGVAHKLPEVVEVMQACISLGHGDTAVKLFEQMLEKGAVRGAHLVHKAVSDKFFQLVAEVLDDKRIQTDGLRFLDLVRAHGIDPSFNIQSRLLVAWKNQPPADVIHYFLQMKGAGVILSKLAYRCIVVGHERSDPELALKVYGEMERSGIQLNQSTYQSVLRARFRLGMHNEARDLFMQMADHGVVPNACTYGIMVRECSSSDQFETAIALFETMREQSLEPDWDAYHHAIRSCIALQRVKCAVELYNDAVQGKVPLRKGTYVLLSGACKRVGWDCLAGKLITESRSRHGAHE